MQRGCIPNASELRDSKEQIIKVRQLLLRTTFRHNQNDNPYWFQLKQNKTSKKRCISLRLADNLKMKSKSPWSRPPPGHWLSSHIELWKAEAFWPQYFPHNERECFIEIARHQLLGPHKNLGSTNNDVTNILTLQLPAIYLRPSTHVKPQNLRKFPPVKIKDLQLPLGPITIIIVDSY